MKQERLSIEISSRSERGEHARGGVDKTGKLGAYNVHCVYGEFFTLTSLYVKILPHPQQRWRQPPRQVSYGV